ncbi:MAG: hypothetical protein DRI90_01425 [Deltaproteobacteria bacterium]|nr:MAG: hypothetical protein DRI90_01425 [Deltaproteobacteria bacterium]
MDKRLLLLTALPALGAALVYCSATGDGDGETTSTSTSGTGASSSSSSGTGGGLTDAGGDLDSGDLDSGPTGPNMCPGAEQSFIWIANTAEGTLSKVCTINGEEVARYVTSPQGASGDPSRTSVNLHGDAVVTNRSPSSGPSSVTKFAGDYYDCDDRNGNNVMDTSLGPNDVRAWGEDECMLWNTPFPGGGIGARATAWDGTEDPDTGLGGNVFIGAMMNKTVYKLDGDTGQILDQAVTGLGHYGGAIDNQGNLWTIDMACTIGVCSIERISLNNLNDHETFPVHCGYGISVDVKGRVWTSGLGCISRFDPLNQENVWIDVAGFNRGIAVGTELSANFVWAANTGGDLVQVHMEDVTVVNRQPVGGSDMVGVAIDYEGYVWTVSEAANSAYKVHPTTWNVTAVPIGSGPYTYSDMTGMQLKGVIDPPR